MDPEWCREQHILLLFSSSTWKKWKRDDAICIEGNHTLTPTTETLMILKRGSGHFISFSHALYFPFHFLWKLFSFMYIMCVIVMKKLYAFSSRKRAVFLVWTLNLPALMLIKPGLMLQASAVSAWRWIQAIYFYSRSFACCIFLVVLLFFIILKLFFIFNILLVFPAFIIRGELELMSSFSS